MKIELWNKHRAGGKKGKDVKEEQAVFHKLDTGEYCRVGLWVCMWWVCDPMGYSISDEGVSW